jgi:DNA-binding NtrC family response regulator
MPENARVIIIEDDPMWVKWITKAVVEGDHSVVGVITTFAEAVSAVPSFEEQKVDVVTSDENLKKYDGSGHDGGVLLEMIRKHAPSVKVISVANAPRGEADATVCKGDFDQFNKLGEIIKRV